MQQVYIGFGANLGDRVVALVHILQWLAEGGGFDSIRTSSLYLTAPEGVLDQPVFLNCVIACRTGLPPLLLLDILKGLEKRAGRVPRGRWREREADLDILLYGDRIFRSQDLVIPHPAMHKRRFVLEPLAEIAPSSIHPVLACDINSIRCDAIVDPDVPPVEKVVDRRALLINNDPVHVPERAFSL